MKKAKLLILTVTLAVIAVSGLSALVAQAEENSMMQSSNRKGSWEFILPLVFTNSTTINGEGNSSVDINSDLGAGFGFGYNINDNFQVNGQFTFSYRGYDAEAVLGDGTVRDYNGNMDTSTLMLNVNYYFMNKNITPYVTAGIGTSFIDTNIPSGTGETYCYWDPWWGYVCNSYVPTKTTNNMSYNTGLGVRWDINKSFTLQGSYNKTWVDISSASGGMPDFDVFKLEFVLRVN